MPETEQQTPPMPDEDASTTDIVKRAGGQIVTADLMTDDEIRRSWRIAAALAASGMFKDAKQAEQAFAKIVIGRDLGMSPAQAMTGLYLVEGKPQVAAPMLGAFVRARGYDFTIMEHTEKVCEILFWRDGDEAGRSRFTMEDATTAGLASKDVWKKYPRNMLFSRAMSNGVKWFLPEALGGIPVYVEGEIEPRPELTEGTGSGEAQGIDLGPEVEKVLARATELGHVGLADRATAEMSLGDQPPAFVVDWVRRATAELDAMESGEPEVVDGEAVDELSPGERATVLQAEALAKLEEAEAAEADGDEERGDALRSEALGLKAAADALGTPEQEAMDL